MRRRPNGMRGAFSALLFAGAAYAWKNRDRLGQQLSSLRGGISNQRTPDTYRPQQLPDYSATEQRDFNSRQTLNEREFGGTKM